MSDYDTTALVARIGLKAFVSTSTSLSNQQILDLCNDSLRSYLVPMSKTLRDEWWVGGSDILLTTDSDGGVNIPDSVASTLRTVAWDNNGVITPLTRIEPEQSFQYLSQQGQLPLGFMLRGYRLIVLPKAPDIMLHLSAMLRPPQMVLTDETAEVSSRSGAVLTLDSVPLEWQSTAPVLVDVVNGESPFWTIGTFIVDSLIGSVLTLTADPEFDNIWVADVGMTPFANVPIELYPLLEQDVIVQLFTGLGDKRLPAAEKRRDSLEAMAKATMAPRAQGNSRPIVNPNAPGMRGNFGGWGRG